jgi:hypothetical protein
MATMYPGNSSFLQTDLLICPSCPLLLEAAGGKVRRVDLRLYGDWLQ